MPHRRTKPSIVLGAVAALAVTTPFAVAGLTGSPEIRQANDSVEAIAPNIAEIALANVPDLVIPLEELTGLNLPDLSLKELVDGIPRITTAPDPNGGPLHHVGAAVKELTQDTPFSLVALAASDVADTDALIRARNEDGSWGPWSATEPLETSRTDTEDDTRQGTEPIYVGKTNAVQVLLTPQPGPEPTLAGAEAPPEELAPAPEGPAAEAPAPVEENPVPVEPGTEPVAEGEQELGYVPASSSRPLHTQDLARELADSVSAVLIDPGSSPVDAQLSDIASPLGNSGLKVISRAEWGADERIKCGRTTYDDSLGGATVHHTAGSNNYSKAESAGIVRAIYAYHAQTLGWCDVGYNVLVDKYGQVFEGRAGGLDRNVQGAHAGGFNENTVGIAMMGDHSTLAPTDAAVDAVGRFLGWRLAKAGLDPKGTTTMYSEGTSFTPYPRGAAVQLPIIFAHRDVGSTSCPGDAGYAQMSRIRDIAAQVAKGGSNLVTQPDRNTVPDRSAGQPSSPDNAQSPAPSTPGGIGTGSAAPLVDAIEGIDTGSAEQLADEVVAQLPELVAQLARLAEENHPLAEKWLAEGGELGRLGDVLTSLLPAKAGFEHVRFVNGALYSSPEGQAWTVLGEIYRAWTHYGLDGGELGLPTSDEYRVPDGWRSDFESGSLIFNEVTGVVTKVLRTYDDGHDQSVQEPEAAPVPDAPAPEPAPAG